MDNVEISKIKLLIDGEEGDKTLKSLQETQKDLNQAIRDMKKAGEEGSEAWKELKILQADLKTQIKEFTDQIDLSDASMKELQASSRQLNRDLSDMKVGSEEWIAQMNRIGETDAKISEVRAEMARLRQEALENTQAYKDLQLAQQKVNQELTDSIRNIDLSEASMEQLRAKSRLLNTELDGLAAGSKEWISKMKEIDDVDTRIGRVGQEMDSLRTNIDKVPSSLDRIKEGFAGTFAAFSLENIIEEVVEFGKESITAAAEMSDAMSDIGKATDMTEAEVAGLVEQINKIDTRTATEDLAEIAVVAGQLGIAKQDVLGFVESVDRAVVALGDEFTGGAEEVAKSIGSLKVLFKETKDLEAGKAINDIGSALNALGAAGSATAPVVADFTARMGQLGDLSPQISQTMGLGAAFQEMGLSAEISAGGLSNILLTAAKDTKTFADALGISETEMKKLINTNPNQFLLDLAAKMKGLPADEVAKKLSDMGIKSQEATKVMSLLKDQTELVTKYQKLASDEMAKGTSLTDEFNKKNNNAAAELAKMGKEVKSMSVDLGQALIPIVLKAGQGLLVFVNTIKALPEFVVENRVAIAALVVALVTFNAGAIAAAASSLALAAAEKGRAIATAASTTAQAALNAIMSANPIGLVITAVALLVAAFSTLYNNSQTLRAGLAGTWEALKTGLTLVGQFWDKLKSLDFAGAAKIWETGGTQIAQAYGKGYSDKIKTEQAAIEADHKAHVEKNVAASKAGGVKSAADAQASNKTGLAGMATDNTGYLSDDQKKRQDHEKKMADDKKKANADTLAEAQKANIAAIADEQARKIAQLKFETEQEKLKIKESLADQATKLLAYTAEDNKYEAGKAALEKEFRDKKAKADQEASDKERKLLIDQITDEHEKKLAELTFQADQKKAEVERTITDEQRKATALDLINKKLSSDIQLENDDQRQKELSKNADKRSKELQAEATLFDNQFRLAVANSDANLLNAKDNAQKIYDAKLDRLKAEYEYNKQKLQNEAAEEKNKNQELIQDHDKRAAADKVIDDRLKSELTANDVKYENDKTQLTADRTQKRLDNQKQFFGAIDSLMTGDYTAFMKILNDKLKNEEAKNDKALQDFTQKGQDTLQVAGQVVTTLQKINQVYLDSQIAKITKEKNTQIAAWQDQYNKGIIDKDTFEKKVAEINKKADEETKAAKLAAWKREQALNITMAVINGVQAALKSLAMLGWPLGLIGAAGAAVAAGVQIAMIKSQQPPSFEKGGKIGQGHFKNAGILSGGRHGSKPGEGGISMIDRATGMEVAEAEGGEPFMVLSRETRKNNGPVIDMLLHSSMNRNGAKIFQDGGTYGDYVPRSPNWKKYADGGVSYDAGSYVSVDGSGGSSSGGDGYDGANMGGSGDGTAYMESAQAADAATREQIDKSQKAMELIGKNTEDTVLALVEMGKFLEGPFLKTIQTQSANSTKQITTQIENFTDFYSNQNYNLISFIKAKLDHLIEEEKAASAGLATSIDRSMGTLIGVEQTGNNYLAQIAAKDLSVQTYVNVFNNINVVAAASDLK